MTEDVLSKINPMREYSLDEVLAENLIPGVKGYAGLYGLIKIKVPDASNKTGYTRVLAPKTDKKHIAAMHNGNPWNKINGRLKIKGQEIVRFLNLNNLL